MGLPFRCTFVFFLAGALCQLVAQDTNPRFGHWVPWDPGIAGAAEAYDVSRAWQESTNDSSLTFRYDCNGSPAQKWMIERGSTMIRLANSNFCVDIGTSKSPFILVKLGRHVHSSSSLYPFLPCSLSPMRLLTIIS